MGTNHDSAARGHNRQLSWLIPAFLLLLLVSADPARAGIDPHFQPLVARLATEGFDQAWLEGLFGQPCMTLYHRVLVLRLTVSEAKINYARFTEPGPIADTKRFLAHNAAAFQKAQAATGVPAEVLAAIFLLETRLGTYMGEFITLRTLATHAVAGSPAVAAEVYQNLKPEQKKYLPPATIASRLGQYSGWFHGELKAFLRYLKDTGREPCQVFGSYTGAIGLCQFQPSNLAAYGRDGNQDGKIDLFQVEDATMSAGTYLKGAGWRDNLTPAQKVAVIKKYNNSTPYAQTILEVARLVKS